MQSTQLACPHCGSMLNFGVDIAAGTPLECLICMRTFVAEGAVSAVAPTVSAEVADLATLCPDVSATMSDAPMSDKYVGTAASLDMAEANPAAALIEKPASSIKRAPKGGVLVSKPYCPPPASAVYAKPAPPPPAPPRADMAMPHDQIPSIARADDAALGGKIVMIAATVGVLFLLTGGLVFAAWKISVLTRGTAVEEKIASKAPDKTIVADGKGGAGQAPPKDEEKKYDDKEDELPPLSQEQKAKNLASVQDEAKQTLTRKSALKPGLDDVELQSIGTIGFSKQPIVGLDQKKINEAIDKGVAYLRRTQNAEGTWGNRGHGVGYASIGGLTLLECGADKKKDMHVQKAAAYVRSHCTSLVATYELSLAILFLDRLGYERDRGLIQGMALKLLAGQNDAGGWHYNCTQLNPMEMYQLYTFLQSHKEPNFLNPLGDDNPKTQAGIVVNPKRDPLKLDDPFAKLSELILTQGIDTGKPDAKTDAKKENVIAPIEVKKDPKTATPKPALKPIRPEALLPSLQKLPIVQNQGVKKVSPKLKGKGRAGTDDNSNTQFAILALWAARRSGVPADKALLASYNRFMTSQHTDGTWGYHVNGRQNPNTMTNVGLLGLAMGHGAAPEIVNFNPKKPKDVVIKPALQDPTIQHGLSALSRYIGQPSTDPKKATFPMQNLYFLWSIERVAMLYDLKTIGGKDWYGWGAQILVHNQASGGEWPTSSYPGASPQINTCFALLFLRRSNLVQDLTNNLRLSTGIADPEK